MNMNSESMLKLIKLPDLLSILNALLGFTAILLVLGGRSVTEAAFEYALILILLAAVVDGLDGMVARNVECSPLGEYLDSLADMISFGVAPAIIVYVLFRDFFVVPSTYVNIVLAFCGAYVISGLLRLARFNAKAFFQKESFIKETNSPSSAGLLLEKEKESNNDFEGFPITGSATFLASFMLLLIGLQFPPSSSAPLLIGLMGILCVLMCSRIRYRKLRDKRITVPVGIIVLSTLLFSYIASLPFVYPAALVVALTAVYMCSPFARVFTPALR